MKQISSAEETLRGWKPKAIFLQDPKSWRKNSCLVPDSSTIGTFDDDWIWGDEEEKKGKYANGIGKP